MAYMTFTDALMQAKRASQLRGTPFTTADTSNLQSAYMSGAAERAAGGRSAALAEQTLAGQKRNFANTLAQERELSNASLTQQKGLSEASLAQNYALSDADLAERKRQSDASLLLGKTLSDAALANARQLAADKIAADKVIADATAAREREAQAAALAQEKELEAARVAEAQRAQAEKIAADKLISDARLRAEREAEIARLAQEKELAGLSREQARANAEAEIKAQEEAGNKALTGNVLSTGATLAGAWVIRNGVPTWLGGGPPTTPPPVTGGAGATTAGAGAVTGASTYGTLPTADAGLEGAMLTDQSADILGAGGSAYGTGGATLVDAASGLTEYELSLMAAENIGAGGTVAGLEATAAGGSAAGGSIAGGLGYTGIGALIAAGFLTKAWAEPYTDQGGMTGWLAESAQHPAAAGFNPPSSLVDAGIIGEDTAVGQILSVPGRVEEWVTKQLGCIIVTACTDRHSPEVEIAREYRDKFLDADQLRGYYQIAEKIVPLIESNGTIKRLVKKWLVDRLVDYGAVVLGKKEKTLLRSSWIVSRAFLSLIRTVGKMREQFVRCNGEVY